jgi:L-amino acid N-acyltransferase YncA
LFGLGYYRPNQNLSSDQHLIKMKENSYRIRLAQISDFDRVFQIWKINQKASSGRTIKAQEEENLKREFWKLFSNPKGYFFVAYEIESLEIIGWQSLLPVINNPLLSKYVSEISTYVYPNYFGLNIGSRLLEFGCNYAANTDIQVMLGWVKSNNIPSIKMMERLNWQYLGSIGNLGTFPRSIPCQLFIYHVRQTNSEINLPTKRKL